MGHIDQLRASEDEERPSVAVADSDRLFVTSRSLIVEIDARDGLSSVRAFNLGVVPIGLDMAPNGTELRITTEGRVVVYDINQQVTVATMNAPAGGGVNFVTGPPGTVDRIPLECA